MTRTNITFRLEDEKRAALDRLAEEQDRDRSYILNQAVTAYLETQAWQRRHIEAALREAEAGGPFVSHEAMERWLESWGEEDELPPPEADR